MTKIKLLQSGSKRSVFLINGKPMIINNNLRFLLTNTQFGLYRGEK